MEGTMGNEGINLLAGVMQGRMKKVSDSPAVLDIGQIGTDMSLTTNQFPKPIPQTDYLVCRHVTDFTSKLTGGNIQNYYYTGNDYESGTRPVTDSGVASHVHAIGSKVAVKIHEAIKPGDRVLVAWVGDDPVVVDIILPATSV